MNNKFILSLICIIGLGVGAYFVTTTKPNEQLGANFGAANAQAVGETDISTIIDMTLGEPDAPIKVVEYTSGCYKKTAGPNYAFIGLSAQNNTELPTGNIF